MESESGVIILAVIEPIHLSIFTFTIFTFKLLTIPIAYEILGSGAAERSTGVDGNEQNVFLIFTFSYFLIFTFKANQFGTLPDTAVGTKVFAKGRQGSSANDRHPKSLSGRGNQQYRPSVRGCLRTW